MKNLFKILAKLFPRHFFYIYGATDTFVEDYEEIMAIKIFNFKRSYKYFNGKLVNSQKYDK